MSRLFGMGLVVLTLALVAAQCGVAQSARDTSNQAVEEASVEDALAAEAEPEGETASAEETIAEASAEVAEDAVAKSSEEAVKEEAVAEAAGHADTTCDDPFADAGSLGFSPQLWTAEQLSGFVRPGLVDPTSGLETNFCLHSIDYSEILSGGPPPDGIPPLDNPIFDSIATGDKWLVDVQPVISLAVGNEAKAYPLVILIWHEIINDEIDGIPVAITFCPLCNTGVVYDRRVDGEVLRFGVSGNLRNSDMVMWDNKTLSWWQQFTGEGIVGEMTGRQLEIVPAQMVAWKDFKAAFPDGVVLSRETGVARDYGRNPYAGYDSSPRPFLYAGTPDPRLPALERVLGFVSGDKAVAYPMPLVAEAGVIEDNVAGQDVVVFYEPGQVSALDQGNVENSKEVGSAAIFVPSVDGQKLTFSYDNGVITDNETGSEWNIFGQATSGDLAGSQLEPLQGRVDFWFAWAAFEPGTTLYGS